MNNIDQLLDEFWKWLGKTPEEYARDGLEYVYDHMEFDFPNFSTFWNFAIEIVDKNMNSDKDIYDLLTILAIDNEGENVLEYIEDNSSVEQVEKIIEIGVSHLQPEARWQLTELLYTRHPDNYMDYLTKLSNDEHWYVRKRAKNCIEYLQDEKKGKV